MSVEQRCKFCGGTVRYRVVGGITRPLRGTCSCPDPGGPTKPWHEDDFCRRTECRVCGQKPIYFVRHNGGTVFFDHLGQPWPKHKCLIGDDSFLALIRGATKKANGIRNPDLYQVVGSEYLPTLKLLALRLRDTNGRRTLWHRPEFNDIGLAAGEAVAICRTAMLLIDDSGEIFRIDGPMVRCQRCNRWFRRVKSFGHRCIIESRPS